MGFPRKIIPQHRGDGKVWFGYSNQLADHAVGIDAGDAHGADPVVQAGARCVDFHIIGGVPNKQSIGFFFKQNFQGGTDQGA